MCALTFALELNLSAWTGSLDGDGPVNSGILLLLVNLASAIVIQARPFLSFLLLQTPTGHTHTRAHTPWPPDDSVQTPGQDLEVSGIPSG